MPVTDTLNYTGAEQTWVVPDGVTEVIVEAWGAEGGSSASGVSYAQGGKGGYVKGTLATTPGETLRVYVGGKGAVRAGGWNGGGTGGDATQVARDGGGGGGASDVRQGGAALSNRRIVAAGGGGSGESDFVTSGTKDGTGGDGGASTGMAGYDEANTVGGSSSGKGATQTAGGAAGGTGTSAGAAGGLGVGGAGKSNAGSGGGGGGGYYGGGGGAANSTGDTFGGGGGGSNYVGGVTATTTTRGGRDGDGLVTLTYEPNRAPNAPILVSPLSGETVDVTKTRRFSWDFSDPDAGDSQSKFRIEIRPAGSGTNTVDATTETTSEHHDVAAGTLTAGDKEWRVRTWDAQGEAGPASAWEPFTAASPPAGPSITDPTAGQTIPTESYDVHHSASEQDRVERRVVADNAGAPDTTTVYWSELEASATSRARNVPFPTNNVWRHVQVRVERGGLWSTWASVRVQVSYTTPGVPGVALFTAAESIYVQADPAPWPVDVSTPAFTGTGTGTITGPTATPGVTDTHDWEAVCVATAVDGGTFDVKVDGAVVGQAVVGTEFTHEGLAFTINDGATDYALGDTWTWSTTAVKVASYEVWVRSDGRDPNRPAGGDGVRVAAGKAPSATWRDRAVASDVDYEYAVVVAGDNQTSARSVWVGAATQTKGTYGGGYG